MAYRRRKSDDANGKRAVYGVLVWFLTGACWYIDRTQTIPAWALLALMGLGGVLIDRDVIGLIRAWRRDRRSGEYQAPPPVYRPEDEDGA